MPAVNSDGSAAPSALVAKAQLDDIMSKAMEVYGQSMGMVYMLTALVRRSENNEIVITKAERIAIEGWILQTSERDDDEAIVLTVRQEEAPT